VSSCSWTENPRLWYPIRILQVPTHALALRVALWKAWGKRCFYSNEPIQFRFLEIDHIIPKRLGSSRVELLALFHRLGLADDFDLDSFENLVPTLRPTNRHKGPLQMTDAGLRLCLERAAAKAGDVRNAYEVFVQESRVEECPIRSCRRHRRGGNYGSVLECN